MKKLNFLLGAILVLAAFPTIGQAQYGVDDVVTVPYVEPGTITLDGAGDESAWDEAAEIPIFSLWEGSEARPTEDVDGTAKVLWTDGAVLLFVEIVSDEPFAFPTNNPWEGDHLLIGIDPTHAGDDQTDDGWSGWPANAPDQGPHVYKVHPEVGVTLNWDEGNGDPIEEGWVEGTVVSDEGDDEYRWAVEIAINVADASNDKMVGFNLAGASTKESGQIWFAWHPNPQDVEDGRYTVDPYYAGDVQRTAASFASLQLTGGPDQEPGEYGSGAVLEVPYVDPGTITVDGDANEEAWQNAAVLSLTEDFAWDGGWNEANPASEPDFEMEARLLYSEGRLYVSVVYEHWAELFFNHDAEGMAVLVGFDPLHEPGVSDQIETDWDGFAGTGDPNESPIVFFIDGEMGVTLNWGGGDEPRDPLELGFVEFVHWVDEDERRWGFEMAILSDAITQGTNVGFNIGGHVGTEDTYWEENSADYAWYSWQVCESANVPEGIWCGPGGTMLQSTYNYGSLSLNGTGVGIERDPIAGELPKDYALRQNYPNPFNPSTTIEFALPKAGHVNLSIYNLIGQRVATLIDGFEAAGAQSLRWSAVDLPSGIYIYQLTVDGEMMGSRKMTLMK